MEVNDGLFSIVSKKNVPKEDIDYYVVVKKNNILRAEYYQINKNYLDESGKSYDPIISTNKRIYKKIPEGLIDPIKKFIRNKEEYGKYEDSLITAYLEDDVAVEDATIGDLSPESLSAFNIFENSQKIKDTRFMSEREITLRHLGSLSGSMINAANLLIMAKKCIVRVYMGEYEDLVWLGWNEGKIRPIKADLDRWIYRNEKNQPLSLKKLLDLYSSDLGFVIRDIYILYDEIHDFGELLDIQFKEKECDNVIIKRHMKGKIPLSLIFLRYYFDHNGINDVKTGNDLFGEYLSWKKEKMDGAGKNEDDELVKMLEEDWIKTSALFTKTIKEGNGTEEKGQFYKLKTNEKARRWKIYRKL